MSDTKLHTATENACCSGKHKGVSATSAPHNPSVVAANHHAHAKHGVTAGWAGAARITLHCLTGCAVGEWIGLSIGVLLAMETAHRVVLAVVLAYVFGFALTLYPLMRGGMSFRQAFKIIWVGETVSIGVMELVMNVVDYQMGGMGPGMSLVHPQYWIAFGVAAIAGYLVAWPVNFWLLKNSVKKPCH